MDMIRGKWALVTGASSGFGVEFATLFAEQQANLVLVGRRTDRTERLAEHLRQQYRGPLSSMDWIYPLPMPPPC
jgi:short-subunit dehydrogenase